MNLFDVMTLLLMVAVPVAGLVFALMNQNLKTQNKAQEDRLNALSTAITALTSATGEDRKTLVGHGEALARVQTGSMNDAQHESQRLDRIEADMRDLRGEIRDGFASLNTTLMQMRAASRPNFPATPRDPKDPRRD
jgi:hypothetical protein